MAQCPRQAIISYVGKIDRKGEKNPPGDLLHHVSLPLKGIEKSAPGDLLRP